ncbi:MAG: glutamate 5-kinase [Opitutaceae bacterium]
MGERPSENRVVPARLIVVKLGTGVLTAEGGLLDGERLASLARQIAAIREAGTEVLVVSSGAVGLGMAALGLAKRPRGLSRRQACAAVGQGRLMQVWQDAFAPLGMRAAQVLLTHEDLRARARYLGVQETLHEILRYRAVPIINENDTVSGAEIRFGDNDTLSAMVASLMEADYLVILSTAPGLIDLKGSGQVVRVVERLTPEIEAMAGGTTSETAVGGMASKISAARIATRAGCGVFIAGGGEPDILARLLAGKGPGTFFVPSGLPLEARKRWLAYFQRPAGAIRVDARAMQALRENGRSLLAVGVVRAEGDFEAGEVVDIAGPDGIPFARGKSGFSRADIAGIAGKHGSEVKTSHPGRARLEVVHRNDLVLL